MSRITCTFFSTLGYKIQYPNGRLSMTRIMPKKRSAWKDHTKPIGIEFLSAIQLLWWVDEMPYGSGVFMGIWIRVVPLSFSLSCVAQKEKFTQAFCSRGLITVMLNRPSERGNTQSNGDSVLCEWKPFVGQCLFRVTITCFVLWITYEG